MDIIDQVVMYLKLAGCYKRPVDPREMQNTAKQYDCSLYLITIEGCRLFSLITSLRRQSELKTASARRIYIGTN